ncbi:MAG: ABC transporter substrate-binding protein [Microbacteriaceae bacterium]|nr:ABC transporter substrate-binding protein [Microbacteriaceae bacterium]
MRFFTAAVATAAVAAMVLTGCSSQKTADGGGNNKPADGKTVDWKTVTSAKDAGGFAALEAAAKKEGELNVIALPHDWSNYGQVIAAFKKKYPEIKVNEQNPDASSKDEIAAAKANKGSKNAPDVFDLGIGVASTSTEYFAPYKVQAWDKVPAENKEPSGLYIADYTGLMTLGWNKDKYGDIDVTKLVSSLSDAKFKGTVALNGKPAEAGAAMNGFLAVNLNEGGTIDDLKPGLEAFKKLKQAGTLTTVDVTKATIDAGQTGVVFDWSYNQLSTAKRMKEKGVNWEIKPLPKGQVVQYYNQAINKDAPHPAAARLWQEFLYTSEAQNLWMKGGAYPVLMKAMEKDGSIDKTAQANLPKLGEAISYTSDKAKTITEWLKKNWDAAIGN